MDEQEVRIDLEAPTATVAQEVEVLEIEDDLDTGMHRVNVCKHPS